MTAHTALSVQSLDQLGLVGAMVDELKIVESINQAIPASVHKKISFGHLVKAMILNGLGYTNKPMYLTPLFFDKKALEQLMGFEVSPQDLNDDALGRTLDALYDQGVSALFNRVAHQAMQSLGIVPEQLHLDSTSFHVDGVYNSQQPKEPSVVKLCPGYSRDHHPQLNQVVLNLIVEHHTKVPVFMQAADGNQSDVSAFAQIVKEHVQAFDTAHKGVEREAQEHPMSSTRVIADAALYTQETLALFKQQHQRFISRVPLTLKQAKALIGQAPTLALSEINSDYAAYACQVKHADMTQQWVLYRSRAAQIKQSKTQIKTLAKDSQRQAKMIQRFIKKRFYCAQDAKADYEHLIASLTHLRIEHSELQSRAVFNQSGRPKANQQPDGYQYQWDITFSMPSDYLNQPEQQQTGYFILATNEMSLDPLTLLTQYKTQQRVERGFRFLKSPEFLVDSFYIKKPQRIEALLMIMTLCLMVYCALEYRIRKVLDDNHQTFPNQAGKPISNPTARWVFACFHEIQVVRVHSLGQTFIANLKPHNVQLLDLLGESFWRYYRVNDSGINCEN